MKRFKTGDSVIIISGLDKGHRGKVTRVISDEDRVVVEGANTQTRRVRARRSGQKGQLVQKNLPVHQARVLPWCDKCKKGVRVRFDVSGDQKIKLCAKCQAKI